MFCSMCFTVCGPTIATREEAVNVFLNYFERFFGVRTIGKIGSDQ